LALLTAYTDDEQTQDTVYKPRTCNGRMPRLWPRDHCNLQQC